MEKYDHNYCININLYHEILSKYKRKNIIKQKYVTLILLGEKSYILGVRSLLTVTITSVTPK